MVGLFNNILPMRTQIDPQQPLLLWLQRLQDQLSELRQYEYSPPLKIKAWSDLPADQPLFESYLVYENFPEGQLWQRAEQRKMLYISGLARTEQPLRVVAVPGIEQFLSISSDRRFFDAATVRRMLADFQAVLESMLEHPEQPLADLLEQLAARNRRDRLWAIAGRAAPAWLRRRSEPRATNVLRRPGTLGTRTLLLIWVGQLVAAFGTGMAAFSLAVWVFQNSGSAASLALMVLFTLLPIAVCSLVARALIERWDRRRTLLASTSGGLFVILSFILLIADGQLAPWSVYLLVAVAALFANFQYPALTAAARLLITKGQLSRTNRLMRISLGVALLLGAGAAGILFGRIGLRGAMTIDLAACLFAIATLLVAHIPRIRAEDRR
jgi:hypothetical protein